MTPPLRLFRFRSPGDEAKPWLEQHSFLTLVSGCPELFSIETDHPPADPPERAVLVSIFSAASTQQVAWVLSEPRIRNWLAAGATLLLDDCNEPGPDAVAWQVIRQLVDRSGLPSLRIVFTVQRGPRQCAEAFDGSQHDVRAVVVHYWMHRFRQMLAPFIPLRGPERARFLCFNYKVNPHRAAVLGYLARHGLLSRGAVSTGSAAPSNFFWPDFETFEQHAIALLPDFADDILAARPVIESGVFIGEPPFVENPQRALHAQTGFSLVTETDMTDGAVLRFTEKTLKPLACGHPFIVAGNPGVLRVLRAYGFETFAPLIDERYDDEPDPSRRLTMVLGEAHRLIGMSDARFDALRSELEPRLLHNAAHVQAGLPMIMRRQMAAARATMDAVHSQVFTAPRR